jgi:hypothetical protein
MSVNRAPKRFIDITRSLYLGEQNKPLSQFPKKPNLKWSNKKNWVTKEKNQPKFFTCHYNLFPNKKTIKGD